jgi:hypothetical protein
MVTLSWTHNAHGGLEVRHLSLDALANLGLLRNALLAEIAGYDSDCPVKQLFGSRHPRIRLVDTQFISLENKIP